MRRFIKTFYAGRAAQVFVLQDSEHREFEVWRWRAASKTCERVTAFQYAPGGAIIARDAAMKHAKQLAEAERICPWCPGFDKTNPANAGVSHKMCPACLERQRQDLDSREAAAKERQ